jgi:4-hydroxyphenylacetate 3-monooxygenase
MSSLQEQAPTQTDLPFTGEEYLESLRDGREIYIYGDRVKDVTTHPAFRNSARSIARMYDALHAPDAEARGLIVPTDTGNGGFTHPFFKIPRSTDELVQGTVAIEDWQRMCYGLMGRTPDYKAGFTVTLGGLPDFYDPYQENAKRWYVKAQEKCLYLNHALVHPPIDRHLPPDDAHDVFVHVEKETDEGLIVSGAKVVATNSALTNHNFVGTYGGTTKKDWACVFMLPMNAPGLKLLCRTSYEFQAAAVGSAFDYPLSSRFDENDSILVLDNVLVPWENVFVYGDLEKANTFFPASGFAQRYAVHAAVRLGVKLDFIAGLLIKAVAATGTDGFRGVQAQVGEVVAWRNLIWALNDAMVRNPVPWGDGAVLPNPNAASAFRVFSPTAYVQIKSLIENTVGSGLIYLSSHARDLQNEEIRPYIDKYVRGSKGMEAEERIKLMKLLWDSMGTEFGGRYELYERHFAGNHDDVRVQTLWGAQGSGDADRFTGFAEQCMAEYDLDGWKVDYLVDSDDVNVFARGLMDNLG